MINNMQQDYMQETVSHSELLGELMMALSKAQAVIMTASKDKSNPFFKSKYADLASVWGACREALTSNGLAVIQTTSGTKEALYLETILGHSSGQWVKSRIPLIMSKMDPQSMGSCITYARRYALSAMVGVCPDDDDDGNAASKGASKKEEPALQLTEGQCDQYIQSWGDSAQEFLVFMADIMTQRKWSREVAIAAFMKDEKYTHSTFMQWKEKRIK